MKLKIKQIEHHRNGISGNPFYVIMFEDHTETPKKNMIDIVFHENDDCSVAILDTDLLKEGDIAFGSNSWRGDHYSKDLYAAIKKDEADYA